MCGGDGMEREMCILGVWRGRRGGVCVLTCTAKTLIQIFPYCNTVKVKVPIQLQSTIYSKQQ